MKSDRNLVALMGISEDNVYEIDRIRFEIHKNIEAWVKEPFCKERKSLIHELEFGMQDLWSFSQDSDYHRYADEYEFKCKWVGRKFRCLKTGEEFTIPYEVNQCDFFRIGEGYVDVGRLNFYSRFSGVVEVNGEYE